jgi:hypothetical protein
MTHPSASHRKVDTIIEPAMTTSTQFAHLFDGSENPQRLWRADEMVSIWEHQLASDLEFDLGGLDAPMAELWKSLTTSAGTRARSFGDLLFHPTSPLPLLELVKEFGKAHSIHPESLLPREISMALYYAAIAAALVRWGKLISSLPSDTLRAGLQRVSEFRWLDGDTRALLRSASEAGGIN